MTEALGNVHRIAISEINRNINQEHVNHGLAARGVVTPDEFHEDMDRLLYDRDTLITEIAQNIIANRHDQRVRHLISVATEALIRELSFRNKPGETFDLNFVKRFFGKIVDVKSN